MMGLQHRVRRATAFDRACALLCLLLLLFSAGHAAVGHGDLPSPAAWTAVGYSHQAASPAADAQDACALCVAMASAAPLDVFSVDVPQSAQPRPPVPVEQDGPVTGWHASLSCRPPPLA